MRLLKSKPKLEALDDSSLLIEYQQTGEMEILSHLFSRYMVLVYGVCLKYLADPEKAKDAVMGIFEELVTKARKHDIQNFRAWLYVLSRNYSLMEIRQSKKLAFEPLLSFMEFEEDSHPDKVQKEMHLQYLEDCKEKLSREQKTSIELFYEKEYCYKDISSHTGYSLQEVKTYIQNGKRNLKICIEKLQGIEES